MAKASWVPEKAQNIQQAKVLPGAVNTTRYPGSKPGDIIPSAWNGRFDGIMVMGLGFDTAEDFKNAMLSGEYQHVATRKGSAAFASKGGVTVKAIADQPTLETVEAIEKLTAEGQAHNEEAVGFADLLSDQAITNPKFFKTAMELRKERLEAENLAAIQASREKLTLAH
jgi:hypothetical protein